MLTQFLITLLIIPILGFIGCLVIPRIHERAIFAVVLSALAAELSILALLGFYWISGGASPISAHLGTLYSSEAYTFTLELYFDTIAAVFLAMTAIMITLVSIFSKYYLHREQGFKRFYTTIFLFFVGLTLAVLAGNFEVLFIGWELIGISSVLLIAFYRDRYLPARNALKVFSVYRIGDAFLLGALLYAHHAFEHHIHFAELSTFVGQNGGSQLLVLGLLLLVVALVKSAQFPFSYWLPRAMEGPTTSSAIFYGALSVHMGVFLLLRTHPLWEGSIEVRGAIAALGLITAIVATSIARVQSSAKTQIAYASIAQIGIMFIELALGLYWLVLIHFVCNAALRAYQLLISPSIVGYLVHDQFFYFVPPVQKIKNTLLGKIRGTFYVLGIKEWNMNTAVKKYVWGPLKTVGRAFAFLDRLSLQGVLFATAVVVIVIALLGSLTPSGELAIAIAAATGSGVLYIRAYATKQSAPIAWNLIGLGHLFSAIFLVMAAGGNWQYLVVYGTGVLAAFVIGHLCLWYVRSKGEPDRLLEYHGVIYVYPRVGNLFFVAALLFMAFPISPSFMAQETLLGMIPANYLPLILLFCVSYLVMGVGIMRLYMKVFFGSYSESHHEKAYRSS